MKETIYEFICNNVEIGETIKGEPFGNVIFEKFKILPDQTNSCMKLLEKEGKLKRIGLSYDYLRIE
ncbi:hypothetical protein CYK85_15415 [Clostridium perfringens]|nr:hypothetical protein CYK85_15415 [Clostridium perfringens]